MSEPTVLMSRPEPAPDAVVAAVQELSAACSKWVPVPTGATMSDPPRVQSENEYLCGQVLHGDTTMVALWLGLILGFMLFPVIATLWRWIAGAMQYTVRKLSASPTR